MCMLGALQRQVDLQGAFVKIGDFMKLKGFSCGIPREQAILKKSTTSRKSPEKWSFLSLAFYNAPSLHTVEESRPSQRLHVYWIEMVPCLEVVQLSSIDQERDA